MKLQIGTDIDLICTLQQNGSNIDLSTVQNLTARLQLNNLTDYTGTTTSILSLDSDEYYSYDYNFFDYSAKYIKNTDNIEVYFPGKDQLYTGKYKLIISYQTVTVSGSTNIYTRYTVSMDDVFILSNNVSSSSNVTLSVSINGLINPTSVTLNYSTLSLVVGNTKQLIATVLPSNAYDDSVKWSSSNSAICTVSSNGLLTGISAGTCTITVTTMNNLTNTCSITVVGSSSVITSFPYIFPLILS